MSIMKNMRLISVVALLTCLTVYGGVAGAAIVAVGLSGATLGSTVATLAEWAKRLDPNGKVDTIVEMLAQTNEILADMQWMQGNLPTGHRVTMRTGLPNVAWRLLNQPVAPSKSTTAQVDENAGMLEAWSEVDKDLAELNGNVNAFRLSEATAFIEAMNQEMASTLIYGNGGLSPEEFTGLAVRYSSLSATNASNVLSGGGAASDNTSIWLCGWGANSVFGIFPKGSKAGLIHEDYGLTTITGTAGLGGTRMRAYQERFQWKAGLALKDWRYVVRIANIDVSNLVAKTSAADITELMIKALYRLPTRAGIRPVFYMNRTVIQMLDIQRRDDVSAGGQLSYQVVDGREIPTFRGVPIRLVDALLETEATVS